MRQKTKKWGLLTAAVLMSLGSAAMPHPVHAATSVSGAGTTTTFNLNGATASELNSTAVGDSATAEASYSTAIGYKATASGLDSTAVGATATATQSNATSLGYGAGATGSGALAAGYNASASGDSAAAIGGRANASGKFALAAGYYSMAFGTYATALGTISGAYTNYSTAIGYDAQVGTNGTTGSGGLAGIAIGSKVGVDSSPTYAGAKVIGDYGIAIGRASTAGDSAVALGLESSANHTNSVALGANSATSEANSVSVGASTSSTRTITNVTAGDSTKDAANWDQIAKTAQVLDLNSTATRETVGTTAVKDNQITSNDGTILVTFTRMAEVASDDYGFVAGADLYTELRPANGTHVNQANTTATNIKALDDASVKAGTYAVTDGKVIVKNNANGTAFTITGIGSGGSTEAVEVAAGTNVTVDEDVDDATGTKTYTVNAAAMGTVAADNTGLISGGTLYTEVRPTSDGTYVKAGNTTAANLSALDTQVNTNTTAITKLQDMETISEGGTTVIQNIAKDAVKVAAGTNVTVDEATDDAGTKTYTVNAAANGKVEANNTGLVSGDTVNTAIQDAIKASGSVTPEQLDAKANLDASNIGTNLKDSDGQTAATETEQKANLDAWGKALGTGTVASDSEQLITGKTLYDEVRPISGEYVSATKTTAENLVALDTQVKTNTGDITNLKDLSNLTEKGKTEITNISKEAAKDAVKVEAGTNVTVDEDVDDATGTKTYTVNAAAMGTVAADNTGLISGGTLYTEVRPTSDGTYVKAGNTTAANLSALDTQVNTNTTAITKLQDMETISEGGTTVIQNIAKDAVKVAAGTNVTVDEATDDAGTKTYTVNAAANGKVEANNTGLVSGDTVNTAIQDAIKASGSVLENKVYTFSKDNAQQAITYKDGTSTAFTIKIEGLGEGGAGTTYTAGNGIAIDSNEISVKYDTTDLTVNDSGLAVKKDGKVEGGNTGIVTGGTVYDSMVTNGSYDSSTGKLTFTNGKEETAFSVAISGSGVIYKGDEKTIALSDSNEFSVKYDATDLTVNDNGLAVKKDGKVESGNTGLVTGGTVYDALQTMDNQVAQLSGNINEVGAGAAALAALHSEGFDPDDKWSFAVGYGHYKNANAAALGVFYKPNADTTVSFGGTLGNGDSMMNAGLSFKLGKLGKKDTGVYRSNEKLVENDRIAALEAENARMRRQIAAILSKMELSDTVTKSAAQ